LRIYYTHYKPEVYLFNYYDLENRESYWISGVKKNGEDRHWAGGGKIKIEKKYCKRVSKTCRI